MATRLKKLRLSELSLVDNPANADAVITLAKRMDDGEDDGDTVEKGRKMFSDVKAASSIWQLTDALNQSIRSILDDEDDEDKRADIEATVDEFKEAVASLVKKDAGEDTDLDEDADDVEKGLDEDEDGEEYDDDDDFDTELVGEDDNASTTSEDGMSKSLTQDAPATDEDIMKNLPESVRKRIEDAERVAKEASENIAKMLEEKAAAEAVTLAKSMLGAVPGDATVLGAALRKMSDAEKAELDRVLKAHNAALKTAKVFEAVGDAGADSDETAAINKRAEDIRKANPSMTREQAIAQALEESPDAYDATI